MPKSSNPSIDLSKLYKPFSQQVKAHTARERFVCYGGAFGGGKTICLVNEAIQLSLDYPGNVGYLCRHELPAFRRSVLIELERYLPEELLKPPFHHHTENYFSFKNGSYIYYGGLGDDKAGLSRLTSMTLGWFGIDQAEETTETHFNMLAGRLRLILPHIHYKGFLTCNPSPGWLKQKFIERKLEDHVFIQSLPKDNPYLPKDYESGLRKIYPIEWVKAMLEGDWNALEGGNFVFSYAEISKAIDREVSSSGLRMMGVDLAWGGADENIVTVREGEKVIAIERWAFRKEDTMLSIPKIIGYIEKYKIEPKFVNLDALSGGNPIYSRLREVGYNVNPFIAGEVADDPAHYVNRRAEMYYQLQGRFRDGRISIPNDRDLVAQLSSIRYEIASEKKLQLVSKEYMRKHGEKSPDRADSLALAFYEPIIRNPVIRWL